MEPAGDDSRHRPELSTHVCLICVSDAGSDGCPRRRVGYPQGAECGLEADDPLVVLGSDSDDAAELRDEPAPVGADCCGDGAGLDACADGALGRDEPGVWGSDAKVTHRLPLQAGQELVG